VVLHVVAGRIGGWELAMWFTSSNQQLDGRRPVDDLDEEPERVVAAARALGEPVEPGSFGSGVR
jgi:hypothetical protein